MSLSIGIVGLPNVGKSTLFNALLKQQVALAANYPFATIDPNVGIAQVPDERLAKLAEVVHTSTIKPAVVEFVDIAGLVKGASEGAGLGNQFLSHIRETDAICHVLRDFSDDEIIREGAVNPIEDLSVIRTELGLADLATLNKQVAPKGSIKAEDKERWAVIEFLKSLVEKGEILAGQFGHFKPEVVEKITRELGLLTAKKEIVVLNVDEAELKARSKKPEELKILAQKLKVEPKQVVLISAKIESELSSLSEEDQELFLSDLGVSESGLSRLAKVAYQTLGLQSFLTAGEKEVRAWTIKKGTLAPQAAGVIHSDFEQKFIKAQVADYDDFIKLGGWKGVKEQGKMRIEGKDYVMRGTDVVEFMIGI